ncbi:MAG TPA: DMT family transporter [Chloroflexia bacterium]|jgi:drug/metabolite transporter (DMT)-like permease
MFKKMSPHTVAVFQALFVTFLWSTSWVLIKTGLQDIPALTFAGLRYAIAFLCLLPFGLRHAHRAEFSRLSRRQWAQLALLGLLFIAVTQGAQFLGLTYLPAITVSLLLSFSPAMVALLGISMLAERPTLVQWGGIVLYLVGTLVYFYPAAFPEREIAGLLIVGVGVLANALSSILGRGINRGGQIYPLTVTIVSMGVGSAVLLVAGVVAQGLPSLSLENWLVVVWLAVVNTAFAFPIWNRTMRTLSAMESSIINNTMLVQIALLAWIFLGEALGWQDIAGLALAGLGALIVQLRLRRTAT